LNSLQQRRHRPKQWHDRFLPRNAFFFALFALPLLSLVVPISGGVFDWIRSNIDSQKKNIETKKDYSTVYQYQVVYQVVLSFSDVVLTPTRF
jgi:hypothetical protein